MSANLKTVFGDLTFSTLFAIPYIVVGIPVNSTLDNERTCQCAGLIRLLADVRSDVRDLDPDNDLTCLRIRSKKNEIMVTPDKDFIIIVIQNPID